MSFKSFFLMVGVALFAADSAAKDEWLAKPPAIGSVADEKLEVECKTTFEFYRKDHTVKLLDLDYDEYWNGESRYIGTMCAIYVADFQIATMEFDNQGKMFGGRISDSSVQDAEFAIAGIQLWQDGVTLANIVTKIDAMIIAVNALETAEAIEEGRTLYDALSAPFVATELLTGVGFGVAIHLIKDWYIDSKVKDAIHDFMKNEAVEIAESHAQAALDAINDDTEQKKLIASLVATNYLLLN